MHIQFVKMIFKIWNTSGKEFASERVTAVYIARIIYFIYSSLQRRAWLFMQVASNSCNSSGHQRFMGENVFKNELVKAFLRIPWPVIMQERHLCCPPYCFPWPRSAPLHFFHSRIATLVCRRRGRGSGVPESTPPGFCVFFGPGSGAGKKTFEKPYPELLFIFGSNRRLHGKQRGKRV